MQPRGKTASNLDLNKPVFRQNLEHNSSFCVTGINDYKPTEFNIFDDSAENLCHKCNHLKILQIQRLPSDSHFAFYKISQYRAHKKALVCHHITDGIVQSEILTKVFSF